MVEKTNECCDGYWLHEYHIYQTLNNGVIEICEKCKDKQFFHEKTPNLVYLEAHKRSALQPHNKEFQHEYGK